MDRRRSSYLYHYSIGNKQVCYKYTSEINFINSARQGDIIEPGIKAIHFGRTSLMLTCDVRNKITQQSILTIDKIAFVSVDKTGTPVPHGNTKNYLYGRRLRED